MITFAIQWMTGIYSMTSSYRSYTCGSASYTFSRALYKRYPSGPATPPSGHKAKAKPASLALGNKSKNFEVQNLKGTSLRSATGAFCLTALRGLKVERLTSVRQQKQKTKCLKSKGASLRSATKALTARCSCFGTSASLRSATGGFSLWFECMAERPRSARLQKQKIKRFKGLKPLGAYCTHGLYVIWP